MTPDEATAKVRDFLSTRFELHAVTFPPDAYWGDDRDQYLAFQVSNRDDAPRLGGCRYIAVHRVTGEVRDLGTIGE